MAGITLLQDLAVVMAVAAVITILCHRFRIPVVLGYILAGLLIGPHTPPYALVKNVHSIEILSELGVVFLLFAIGLEFSISRLMKVGAVAFFAATVVILFMIPLGYFVGRTFGWNFMDSLFLGAILSISSTTIIAKVLMESKKFNEKFAQVILGILIIEDLLAIILIAVLSGLATSGALELETVGRTAVRVAVFTAVTLVVGFLAIPRLLRYLEKINVSEMLVVSVLGLCFAGALAAVKFGFSVALGAFLVGAIIAETKQIKKVIHKIEPIRDMFTAVFFVSVGMMIEPAVIGQYWAPILIITVVAILGIAFSAALAAFMCGYRPDTALMVGLGLAQIGEFSFIIATLGENTGVTSGFLYPITVSVAALTTLTTPFLMRGSSGIAAGLRRITPQRFQAFLELYTGWARSIGRSEQPKRAIWSRLFGAAKINAKIEKMIADILDPAASGKSVHDELAKFIRDEYPWEAETADFMIPLNDSALNLKLSELRLRSETGATIVAIYRDTESIANPSADMVLAPGDVLLVLGSKAQVQSALAFLQKKAKEPLSAKATAEKMPKTLPFIVTAELACVGKSMEELKLKRRSGATILGIQKSDLVTHNPTGGTVIEEGDVLMLFGWPEQLEAAVSYLSAK